ncbi:hypothetical protein H6P81_004953 [Aristolochia fimbriata]|uniref:Uncharacterized protein n=1 Tax=Aristolochia fimbriata TaxID=158543 RepID=A0AAV7EUI5_ARIFI|nr:hypothetical protein H6P81_004953 [Aristolochia fimbriata]
MDAETTAPKASTMRRVTYSSSSFESEEDELKSMMLVPNPKPRRHLSKQLSMQETSREAAWERRRRQRLAQARSNSGVGTGGLDASASASASAAGSSRSLTDEDLDELKGSIDLGFGFNEEDGAELCGTLPALDLYFAVNRQLSDCKHRLSSVSTPSPVSTPRGGSTSSIGDQSTESPRSPHLHHDPWKICNPGDNPQHVKTRLRHWAQAVACSVRQFS